MNFWSVLNARDIEAFYHIYQFGHNVEFIVKIAIFSAKKLIYWIPLHLILMWLLGTREKRKCAFNILFTVILGLIFSYFIGVFFDRPRPFIEGLVEPLILHRGSPSFPSNHALIFSIYIAHLRFFHYKFIFFIGLIFMILTCWARIFVGIHYPLDILGGIFLGKFLSVIMIRYGLKFIPNWILEIFLIKK